MADVSPHSVILEVSEAIPSSLHDKIIIVGSLAAGYHFFGREARMHVRTKDIDCILHPRIEAVETGATLASELLKANWELETEGDFGKPGTESTEDKDLPILRLYPPKSREWFIEVLTVPNSETDDGTQWLRFKASNGYYGLRSFKYLSLATYNPLATITRLKYARPEMMVLANLLEHPFIKPETMSGLIQERKLKRSNKDLGRVFAITFLSEERDIVKWLDNWTTGMKATSSQTDLVLHNGSMSKCNSDIPERLVSLRTYGIKLS